MKFDHLDLCLLRHGQTQWNLIKRVQGRMDSHLTQLGKSQALRQGEILFNQKDTVNRTVFCSPTGRVRETAELIFQKNKLKCEYDERLVEISVGDWEGQLQSDIQLSNPALFLTAPAYLSLYGAAPNGEGVEGLRNRCIDFCLP